MGDSPERLAVRLRTEGEKTVAFFQELTPEEMGFQIYESGSNWSVRQILAHFASTELGFADLIDNILSGGAGSPDDFDIDRYNERRVAKLQPVEIVDLLSQFAAAREENIRRVETMQPADMERQGRHPFLGVVPLEEIVKLLYRHNQIHQRDIRRAISPEQP
jgi:hypothetical protein